MFTTISYKKVNWVKNKTKEGGAMDEVLKNKKVDDMAFNIISKKQGRMWGSCDNDTALKLIEKNIGINEILHKFPMKVYFDIDKTNDLKPDDLTTYKNIILKHIPDATMAISGSETETKHSYHITLTNYIFQNEQERDNFKLFVKTVLYNEDNGFDSAVYTKNRNMKCINQSKPGCTRIQKIIEDDDIKNHLITSFINDNCKSVKLPENIINVSEQKTKEKRKVDIMSLPKIDLGDIRKTDLTKDDLYDPINLLNLLPISKDFDHTYTWMVARFCFYNELTFDDFYNWYKVKNHSQTHYDKWKHHWSVLGDHPPVRKGHIMLVLEKYYPGMIYEMSGDASKASIFATQPTSPEIKSVAQARRSPVWGVPGGYKEVGKKEVVRVIEEHKAMTYVSKAAVEAARSRYGRENVHIRKIVMPFKEKTSAANFHTRYKARITIADLVVMGKVDNTFAATVAMDSIRFLTNTALRTGGKIRMLDVGGAYLFGTPTDPGAPGGRVLFAPVPEGFDEFGDEYQQYDADGNQMYFRIDGNLPGRQDAGRIWGDMYTSFLVEEGFTQSIVDRRIFSKLVDRNGKKEQIVIGVFVDDSWIMSTHDDLYAEFYDAWAKRFDEAPDVQDTCDEFCGLVFTHRDDGSVSLSCPKLLHNLGEKLAEARAFDASKGSLSGTAKHAHRDCPTTPLGVDGLTFVTAAAHSWCHLSMR